MDVAADALIGVVRKRLCASAGFAIDDVVPEGRCGCVNAPGGVLLLSGDRDAIVPPERNARPLLAALNARPGAVLESITGRRPAWDIFKPLYLAQIELVFYDS
jgi:hypothetical protein